MKIIKPAVLSVCFFLVYSCPFAQVLLRGNAYEMSVTQPDLILKIPVKLPEGSNVKDFPIDIVDVKFNNKPDNFIIPAFEAYLEDTLKKSYIKLVVAKRTELLPGVYNFIIRKRKTDADPTDTIQINVTVRPAAIRVPAVLSFTHVNNIFDNEIFKSDFSIYETTGHSYVKSIVIQKNGDFIDPGGLAFPGEIKFNNLEGGVGAGKQVLFDYYPKEKFPVGKTSGNFEIISPQLSAPIPFRIEVTYKKGWVWLVGFIVLGLLFGYLTRTYFEWHIQRNSARLKAVELLKRITKEQSRRPDKKFHEETKKIYDELLEGIDKKKPEDITGATTTAETNLNAQITAFTQRREKVQTDLDSLKNLISQLRFPNAFNPIIETTNQRLKTAYEENERRNVGVAEEIWAGVLVDLDRSAKQAAAVFGRQIIDDSLALENSPLKLENLKTKVAELRNSANTLINSQEPKEILFKNVHDTNNKIIEFMNLVAIEVRELSLNILSIFRDSGLGVPDTSVLESFSKSTNDLVNEIRTKGINAEFLHQLSNVLEPFHNSLKSAITSQLNITNPDATKEQTNITQRTAIRDDIKNGLYREAAKKTIIFLDHNKDVYTPTATSASRFELNDAKSFISQPLVLINKVFTTHTHLSPIPVGNDEVDIIYQRSYRALLAAKAWQTVFAGIIITALGYFLYAASFMGSLDDMAKAFLWAFTLDVSVATMLAQIQAWRPKQT